MRGRAVSGGGVWLGGCSGRGGGSVAGCGYAGARGRQGPADIGGEVAASDAHADQRVDAFGYCVGGGAGGRPGGAPVDDGPVGDRSSCAAKGVVRRGERNDGPLGAPATVGCVIDAAQPGLLRPGAVSPAERVRGVAWVHQAVGGEPGGGAELSDDVRVPELDPVPAGDIAVSPGGDGERL